jgi:transcriptional regulator with XRE-family HTH domain
MLEVSPNQELRLFREFIGVSQAQLAQTMGTTQTSVARWESAISPITPMTMAHVRALVEAKVKEETQRLFAKLVPELALCDFEGLYGLPNLTFMNDKVGNLYIGMVEIMGYRKHSLHIRLDDRQWYGLDREGTAVKVDRDFLWSVRLKGRLQGETSLDDKAMKDDPRVQRERIRKLAAKTFPDFIVVFDDSQPFTWIRFRFDESTFGRVIGAPSGHFHVSEIADWTDEKLINYMQALAPSFVR